MLFRGQWCFRKVGIMNDDVVGKIDNSLNSFDNDDVEQPASNLPADVFALLNGDSEDKEFQGF